MILGSLSVGGLLDKYVARLFVMSYLAAFFLVVGVFTIMDLAVNLDEYLRPDDNGEAPSSLLVVRYYAHQMPFLYLQMSPYVTLLAGMFTAAKMSRHNEIVAALGAGISARRLFAAVFLVASLLSAGMFGLREWATDELGSRRDALLDHLRERRPVPVYEGFWVRDSRGHTIRVRRYYPAGVDGGRPEISGLSSHFDLGGNRVDILAETARPLAAGAPDEEGRWEVTGGKRLESGDPERVESTFEVLDELRFTPEDVELAWKGREHPLDLSFSESLRLLERDPTNAQYRTLLHYHLTFPLAGLILLMVGLPFVIENERGKAAERIAKGFLLCVLYFGLDFVSRTLGLQGQIGPLHAGWLPVLSFGTLGLVLFGFMRS
jgi:lipopolysaccharide export system permease protein